MKIFNLPDLGEGLADAEIRQWYVKVGDNIKVDAPLVAMETAKALVDVPAPQSGVIEKLYGAVGDVINTGSPLVAFSDAGSTDTRTDGGSVVGRLEESSQRLEEGEIIIGSARTKAAGVKAMPAVRQLAKELNVDLSAVTASGKDQQITAEDVKQFAAQQDSQTSGGGSEPLRGVRRSMAIAMEQSQKAIVPVTIIEDADITDLPPGSDITVRIMQAIASAVQAEPSLNAWFDGKQLARRLFPEVNIGLAVDTEEGLFVPVIKDIAQQSAKDLRTQIDTCKQAVKNRTLTTSDLHGATITLSNFGMLAGRYATPIIVPPQVAILGCGKIRDVVMARQGKMEIRRSAPLSLTFDHRAVTGGEATRFLAAVIQALEGKV